VLGALLLDIPASSCAFSRLALVSAALRGRARCTAFAFGGGVVAAAAGGPDGEAAGAAGPGGAGAAGGIWDVAGA
jgi:hypothetical protein